MARRPPIVGKTRGAGDKTPRQRAAAKPLPSTAPPAVPVSPAAVERQLEEQMVLGYKPNLPFYSFRDEYWNPWEFFWDVEAMIKHDSIKTPLCNVIAPIMGMQVTVPASSARVANWAVAEWTKFKEMWLIKIMENGFSYGWMGGEPVYGVEQGKQTVIDFLDFHPRDTQPLVKDGNVVGIQVKNTAAGSVNLPGSALGFPAKGFWYPHQARFGQHYGRSQIEPAWKPWRRLTGRDGVEETNDLAIYKAGTGITMVGYPAEDVTSKNQPQAQGTRVSGQQRAMDLGEHLKAGGVAIIPTTQYERGGDKWYLKFEQPQTNLNELIEADKQLYVKISKAIGFPPELLEAAETGSGFSGRQIPLQAFMQYLQPLAQAVFFAWWKQIGQPLMWWNYGEKAWANPKVDSLLATYRAASAGPQPGGAQAGAMPGTGGSGIPNQPAAPPQAATQPTPPPTGDGMQPYQGPRGGKGWKDAQNRIHYSSMLSSGVSGRKASLAVQRGIIGADEEDCLNQLVRQLPSLEPQELDELEAILSE